MKGKPMINEQTLAQLQKLKLLGLAHAFEQQLQQPGIESLSFQERLALLVQSEVTWRENHRLKRLLKQAKLRQQACVEQLDTGARRGLDRSLIASLVTCDWIRSHHDLQITGATGTGKSWLACMFGHQACRQGLSVRYERVSRLLEELRLARGDGSLPRKFTSLAKIDLLVLDDFGLKPLTSAEKHDLLEVIEDRHGLRSTLITSQLPASRWHEYLDQPTLADALLDRLLAHSHKIELKGESLRKAARS
jgi:DNA replication protein DnaC